MDLISCCLDLDATHVVKTIFSHLDVESLLRTHLVCKRWNDAALSLGLWELHVWQMAKQHHLILGFVENELASYDSKMKSKDDLRISENEPKTISNDLVEHGGNRCASDPKHEIVRDTPFRNIRGVLRARCIKFKQTFKRREGLFCKNLYHRIREKLKLVDYNWTNGICTKAKLKVTSSAGVNCIDYDSTSGAVVAGHEDGSLFFCLDLKSAMVEQVQGDKFQKDSHTETFCLLRKSLAKARWTRKEGTLLNRCIAKAHSDEVYCIQLAGSLVFSGGADHWVRVWDLTTGAQLQIHPFNAFVWAMKVKGDVLVTGCCGIEATHCNAMVFDWKTTKVVPKPNSASCRNDASEISICPRWTLSGHEDPIWEVDFDTCHVVTASNATVRLWCIRTGQHLHMFEGWIRVRYVSLIGNYIICGSRNGIIRLWNIQKKSCDLIVNPNPARLPFFLSCMSLSAPKPADFLLVASPVTMCSTKLLLVDGSNGVSLVRLKQWLDAAALSNSENDDNHHEPLLWNPGLDGPYGEMVLMANGEESREQTPDQDLDPVSGICADRLSIMTSTFYEPNIGPNIVIYNFFDV